MSAKVNLGRPTKKSTDPVAETVSKNLQDKKRLNAEVPASLYQRIKLRAVEEGRSISDITRELWEQYLSK